MKIKKQLIEEILTEADDEVLEISSEDSGKEVLDQVEKAADNADITNSAEIAAEIVQDADKINAEKTVGDFEEDTGLEVENKITKALDQALKAAIRFKKKNISEVANVMICGLPGSGKTACVYDWAKHAKGADGQPINMVYLNMKNNDLDAFINGYTVQDKTDPDYVKQAFSHNLDGLNAPNSILFLDEYNRQTEDQIRASVLTLINEHYIVGKDKNGKQYFPNFLFTIAVMNPAVSTDRGAAKLNDAEKTRFLLYFDHMDSDPETTKVYLTKQYDKLIKNELNKAEPDYDEIEEDLRIKHLGIYIVNHPDFKYDDETKLRALDQQGKKMLNQRALTAGLVACGGNVRDLIRWIESDGANFLENPTKGTDNYRDSLDEATEILLAILADYQMDFGDDGPTRAQLFKEANIALPGQEQEKQEEPEQSKQPEQQDSQEQETETAVTSDTDDEIEDDSDFFAGGQIDPNATTVDSPATVKQKIIDITNLW